MTNKYLLHMVATALFFTAACKGEFQAGTNAGRKDGSTQLPIVFPDGGNPDAREGRSPASSITVACDPFNPTTKPITLGTVLGAGQDTDGTLYVVAQTQDGKERVFVSVGTILQRQRLVGSGAGLAGEPAANGDYVLAYTYDIVDHFPPFTLKLETNDAGPTAMGVLQGAALGTDFTIGQEGSVLTLVPASQVAAMPVANLPAETVVDCNATIPDGRVLLVVRPRDDWTYADLRVFFGAQDHLIERPVDLAVQHMWNAGATVNFTVDGVAAVANYPGDLTIGSTVFPLTMGPVDSPRAEYAYFCLENPSPDGGVDALVPLADGPPGCRAPSPDYGPTSVFSLLPNGTPEEATACPAACGDSAWPVIQSYPNIDTALPYGSCAPGTPSCTVGARVPCACALSQGPLHDFNCSCEAGTWICRILVMGAAACLPCPDAGPEVARDADADRPATDLSPASDLPPDSNTCLANSVGPLTPAGPFTDEQSCVKATCVSPCDWFGPGMNVTAATGGPLLTEVRVTSGSCTATPCPSGSSGCSSISVHATANNPPVGTTCDLVAIATDGRSHSLRITVVQSGPAYGICCGYPLPPYPGQWGTYTPLGFDNTNLVVDFNRDGGLADGEVDASVTPADGPVSCRAPSPDYGPTSVFSFLPSGTPEEATACPAACGDSAWPVIPYYPNIDTALPYGSCAPGTPSCSTGARVPCAVCSQSTGPLHSFNCSCEGGNWICRIRMAGAAMCMPCPDGGVEQG